jgi:hypothetical protein
VEPSRSSCFQMFRTAARWHYPFILAKNVESAGLVPANLSRYFWPKPRRVFVVKSVPDEPSVVRPHSPAHAW